MSRLLQGLVCCLLAFGVTAGTSVEDLRKEVEGLRKDLQKKGDSGPIGRVDSMTGSKYGPNTAVTTKAGKLSIGGLVQVWYQSIQNDNVGVNDLSPFGPNGPGESNEVNDNDSFRIRRTELRFTMDVHENVTAYVMMDPARESNIQFFGLPTIPVHNTALGNPTFVQTGRGLQGAPPSNTIIPQLLQDAYINFHDVVPHHDFTIGQFKPPAGEEAWRNSGQLEFVERAMVTGVANVRDIGVMLHGTWWDNRFQYWVGVFNGPTGTVLNSPEVVEGGNRTDDNDAKNLAWRIAVRPVWSKDKWYGRLELGYARMDGLVGESSGADVEGTPVNGLNAQETSVNRNAAWAWYRPGGPVSGWWLRGEWGNGRDRFYQQGVGTTPTNFLGIGGRGDGGQINPAPLTLGGWYFGTGYKMSESVFAEGLSSGGFLKKMLHDTEFAFRYEVYDNIVVEDLVNPDRHSDEFKTQAYTAGLNYYIRGHDAKIQLNYIWVDEPSDHDPNRGLREFRNDVFVVNFQVMF